MTVKELKAILENVPDEWIVVVEQPEGDRYHTQGSRGDEAGRALLIEL